MTDAKNAGASATGQQNSQGNGQPNQDYNLQFGEAAPQETAPNSDNQGHNERNHRQYGRWLIPEHLGRALHECVGDGGVMLGPFITNALRSNCDEQLIIMLCMDEQTFSGSVIVKHVREHGGQDYIKQKILEVANSHGYRKAGRKRILLINPDDDTDLYWRETEQALIDAKCPVFVRTGVLVWPCWRWETACNVNVLVAELQRYNQSQLTDMVQHHAARFEKMKYGHWHGIDPPPKIIQAMLTAGHWKLKTIIGIVTSPTLRPDCSIITEPGFDEATQLWYKPSDVVTLPPIAFNPTPTHDDAVAALTLLNDLLQGFPFDGETEEKRTSVSRSAALAGLMTAVARGSIQAGVPLFLVTANTARTGKTFLINMIGLIATGHIPVSIAGSEKKEEMEKRVETAALTGRAIMHFNNLPNGHVIESDRLCELSTEGIVNIRKLGRHEEGQCDCRATTAFLNGNNILFGGDLVVRTATVRLNAGIEKPEEREFLFDPMQRARADRGAYLAAVFTIIKAFRTAGSPPQKMKRVAGFGEWSQLIRQPLIWLGQDDPFGSMEDMMAMDPREDQLSTLLGVLKKYRGDKIDERVLLAGNFAVADCTKLAEQQENDRMGRPIYKRPDLRELMTNHGKLDGRYFGRLLMANRDKIKDGWCIKVVPSGVRAKAFRLVGPPDAPPPPPEKEDEPM